MQNARLNGQRTDQPSIEADLNLAAQAPQDEYIFSVKDPLRAIWQARWLVVLVTLVFTGSAITYSLLQTPIYRAHAKVIITGQKPSNASNTPNPGISAEVQGLKDITQTATLAVDTRPVAEATIEQLGLEMSPEALIGNLNAKRLEESQFIEISYDNPDAQEAQLIVNTVGEVFSEQIQEVSPGTNALAATVWEEALMPGSPVSPNPVRYGTLGLALGCALGIGLAFLLERLDDLRRSSMVRKQVSHEPTHPPNAASGKKE